MLFCGLASAACTGSMLSPSPPADVGSRRRLSQLGLFTDVPTGTLAPDVLAYEPAYALWSDGAEKQRFLVLPPHTQIDTSDMDHWELPVGAKVFKEFSLNGRRLETRLLERTPAGYGLSAFIWTADGSDAIETPEGADNVLGTDHDVPSASVCGSCHDGEPGRLLGFSAIQLSRSGPAPTLSTVASAGLLSSPPPAGVMYPVPGDARTSAALGYLHANCGHCHNPSSWPAGALGMQLRLNVADRTPRSTTIWRTTVDQQTTWFRYSGTSERVASGDPAASAIVVRMSHRGDLAQMPPIATERVDTTGLSTVSDWIRGLP